MESLSDIISKGIAPGGGKGLPPTTHVSPREVDENTFSSIPAVTPCPAPAGSGTWHLRSDPAVDTAEAQSGSGVCPEWPSCTLRSWDRTELSRLSSILSGALSGMGVGRAGCQGSAIARGACLRPSSNISKMAVTPNMETDKCWRGRGEIGSPGARMVGVESGSRRGSQRTCWGNSRRPVHVPAQYSATKRKGVLAQAPLWLNLKNLRGEHGRTQRTVPCDST